jgi:glycine dehydrogenase subunit 1
MPYIPHTPAEIEVMLATIGVATIEDLFDEIPPDLRCGTLEQLPDALTEIDIMRLMRERAAQDSGALCFIGAGAYEHHIPAAVWEIATRGEFYSAYTPYQAEASQGTLQLLYEYQSMMAQLNALDASNASLYDGATALAEAVLMAVRLNHKNKSKQILMPRSVHPLYRKVVHSIVKNQGIHLHELPYDPVSGQIDSNALPTEGDFAALVIPQPNFFGVLEECDPLTEWAHAREMMVIGVVNPLSLALLKPPGEWGTHGADIACGEGQPLGIPLSSGGPYFGFMCCKKQHIRQMPGRIVGRTVDLHGQRGYTLTLQAREQHIRRSKATSNICTNQGLMVTAATIYLTLMGAEGLEHTALNSHANTQALSEALSALPGVSPVFEGAIFHEKVLRLPLPVQDVLRSLAASNILGGYDLSIDYPELGNTLLVCATELRNSADIQCYAERLSRILTLQAPPCIKKKPS